MAGLVLRTGSASTAVRSPVTSDKKAGKAKASSPGFKDTLLREKAYREYGLKIAGWRQIVQSSDTSQEAILNINKELDKYILKKKTVLLEIHKKKGANTTLTLKEHMFLREKFHNPTHVKILIGELRDKWPEVEIPERWTRYFSKKDIDETGISNLRADNIPGVKVDIEYVG